MNDNPSLLLASAVLAAASTLPVRAAWVAGVDGHGYETLARDGVTIVYGEDDAHPGWIGSQPGTPDELRALMEKDLAGIVAYFRSKWPGKPIPVYAASGDVTGLVPTIR